MHFNHNIRWRALGVIAAALSIATGAQAQGFPDKAVTVVVPFAAGGAADVLARLLTQDMKLGQPVLVDNRGGAGGSLGAGIVAKSPADGHTVLLVTAGHAGLSALYPKLSFDPIRDFVPVLGLAKAPIVITVNTQSPYRTLPEFVAGVRANQGKYNCAGGGGGATVTNLALESLKRELKLEIGSIPYRGSAPAITGLLGGEIDCDSDTIAGLMPHIQAGKLRALAVTSKERSNALPNVPTVSETVLPNFDASVWFGVLAPKGTPRSAIDKLRAEFAKALAVPATQARMKELGYVPWAVAPDEFGRFLGTETKRWSGLIQALGLKPE